MISSYSWLIPALPAVSALIIIFFGRRLTFKGVEIGLAAVGIALILSIAVAIEIFSGNVEAAQQAYASGPEGLSSTVTTGGFQLAAFGGEFGFDLGMQVDGLTAMMFLLVTAVSLMVHWYSIGYMHGDPRFTWYFALLSLFTFSMLLLVIADNMLLVLVGWELVGVCSFLLIGFWWEEKRNSDAAVKAFLTTKIADAGLVVGVVGLWGMFGTFNIAEILSSVQTEEYSQGMLTFSLVALFLGAIGKSAQFPLHTWLPDAMAGPTPASSLIHAATMVTAGVFLIARLYPAYSASATAQAVVAIVGAITLLIAGLLALVQDDVKKVLAYSTVSQLGYMVTALAFSYTAGIFHLFTHGFFKALLFMGAGSLIHSVHSNNMSDMGGLRKPMPITFVTFLIGSVALMAIPPFAGFWSKDEILAGALGAGTGLGWTVLVMASIGGFLTAFYMTRVLFLVFAGSYRGHGTPHESGPAMTWPLVILAVPSALIGFVNLPFEFAHPHWFTAWTMPSVDYFITHPPHFSLPLALVATGLAALAVFVGSRLYREAPTMEDDPTLNMGGLSTVLVRKYYLDVLWTDIVTKGLIRDRVAPAAYWVNDHVIDRAVYLTGAGIQRTGDKLYDVVDQKGIDGFINGLGLSTRWSSAKVRLAQSGNVQLYAGAMFVGVFVLAIAFATA